MDHLHANKLFEETEQRIKLMEENEQLNAMIQGLEQNTGSYKQDIKDLKTKISVSEIELSVLQVSIDESATKLAELTEKLNEKRLKHTELLEKHKEDSKELIESCYIFSENQKMCEEIERKVIEEREELHQLGMKLAGADGRLDALNYIQNLK